VGEHTEGSLSLRITKKGEPLIHRENTPREQDLSHDRSKARLLDGADPFLLAVGISDSEGKVKPSKMDKYKQVEETIGILQYSTPSVIFILGITLFGEVVTAGEWVGFGLIWVALAVFSFDAVRNSRRPDLADELEVAPPT